MKADTVTKDYISDATVRIRGEERQNELTKCLLRDNRLEDLRRAVDDRSYREQLLIEYGIKESAIVSP